MMLGGALSTLGLEAARFTPGGGGRPGGGTPGGAPGGRINRGGGSPGTKNVGTYDLLCDKGYLIT